MNTRPIYAAVIVVCLVLAAWSLFEMLAGPGEVRPLFAVLLVGSIIFAAVALLIVPDRKD